MNLSTKIGLSSSATATPIATEVFCYSAIIPEASHINLIDICMELC